MVCKYLKVFFLSQRLQRFPRFSMSELASICICALCVTLPRTIGGFYISHIWPSARGATPMFYFYSFPSSHIGPSGFMSFYTTYQAIFRHSHTHTHYRAQSLCSKVPSICVFMSMLCYVLLCVYMCWLIWKHGGWGYDDGDDADKRIFSNWEMCYRGENASNQPSPSLILWQSPSVARVEYIHWNSHYMSAQSSLTRGGAKYFRRGGSVLRAFQKILEYFMSFKKNSQR